ncbi:MAG TPA: hypothetical protein P5550_00340 [Bacteroidales bacterium]|nr:hypothetical protein [Bacteroidales bacterium]
METLLYILTAAGFAGFIFGLYCQYRSRNRMNIRRNRIAGVLTAASLIVMLAAAILIKMLY